MNEEDRKAVMKLRNYYRKNFQNGASDESFLLWIERTLEAAEQKRALDMPSVPINSGSTTTIKPDENLLSRNLACQ